MAKKRTLEDVSTKLQNLNEVYDAKVEELTDGKKRTFEDVHADRDKLDREYWARVEELNQEWEQLMSEES